MRRQAQIRFDEGDQQKALPKSEIRHTNAIQATQSDRQALQFEGVAIQTAILNSPT